ncbi:oligopeptide/dipeptide ABC transporter ATP-binding protein [Angulomicrobium tetraedrale]|uniref:Oligopeptide/dipeptide ABC transporter ATP-binding protein n=1 Tax=Ancylobacter tetraedralis TaxID=217068 RepID=A0A839ZCW4_9HYPH|nr:ABC transporter ATP-binding protein [Ancylobacter tetraedralis]MBB3772690.1 oligopeptide/dipeptide ABC transporter ATP-binding protein [Ancylobacter tetraedralis]
MNPDLPMITIRNLKLDARTEHGPAHILRGIDLEFGRGRIVGVVGESGSGKSTLVSCLLRLLPSNIERLEGEILFDGIDLLKLSPSDMNDWRGRKIAMVFQDPMTALNPLFTINTHLRDVLKRRFPQISAREARERSLAMLTKVGISDASVRLDAYPHQLSGGMRQRIVIAMALLVEPDLLLADEPTTALDATVEAQIVDLFDQLRQDFSGSIVFISHHLGLVAELCDDLCVMYGGTIVETGPVAEVLARPRHPYTRALLDCEIEDDHGGRLATIPGEVPSATWAMDACIFASRCAHVADICRRGPTVLETVAIGHKAACKRSREVLP